MGGKPGPLPRRATPADARVVAQMLFDFNTEFETETPGVDALTARLESLLAREDVVAVIAPNAPGADPGEQGLGLAFLTLRPTPWFDGKLAQLEELYVRPGFRGSGIGSALLEMALALVREHGGEEMHINVDEIDSDARRFYERHGFVNIEAGCDYRMLSYLRTL